MSASQSSLTDVVTGDYYSASLDAVRPYTLLKPPAGTPEPFPLLVLLHGRNYGHDCWVRYTRLKRYARQFPGAIACYHGDNGWYTDGLRSPRYETDLISDFLTALAGQVNLCAPGMGWAIGGASMGGFGAVKIALKHPDLFATAFSLAASLDRAASSAVDDVFGDPVEDAAFRRAENPYSLAEDALSLMPAERPWLAVDCGLEDALLESNRRFRNHMHFIGYPLDYTERPGQHTWPYFDRALRDHMSRVAMRVARALPGP